MIFIANEVVLVELLLLLLVVFSASAIRRNLPKEMIIVSQMQSLPERWIEQKLDHFHNTTNKTWRMRYFATKKFYRNGGPMFLLLGGPNAISSELLLAGYFSKLAERYHAYLFALEHRFYGKSLPTENLSIDNLKYLTIEQALADIAYFIATFKDYHVGFQNAKVILAGCKYAGSLVVWMKRLYPNLVTGGWASSAPLLAKTEYPETVFYIGKAIRSIGGIKCYNKIKNGIFEIEKLFAKSKYNRIKELLKICDDVRIDSGLDAWSIFLHIASSFAAYVGKTQITSVCEAIQSIENDSAKSVANWIIENSFEYFQNGCLNVTYTRRLLHSRINITDFSGDRQWLYQKCNELGWFQTTQTTPKNAEQPFGNKIRFYFYGFLCSDVFGYEYTRYFMELSMKETNNKFGGLNPNVSGIFMTYGEHDAWQELGIKGKDKMNVTILPGAFPCDDMRQCPTNAAFTHEAMCAVKENLTEFIRMLLVS